MPEPRRRAPPGNFISEWFGHRVYPKVVASRASLSDQSRQLCPFLTRIKEQEQVCIKAEVSKGVCTVSSISNGPRQ